MSDTLSFDAIAIDWYRGSFQLSHASVLPASPVTLPFWTFALRQAARPALGFQVLLLGLLSQAMLLAIRC
jgi:hypothetical protein